MTLIHYKRVPLSSTSRRVPGVRHTDKGLKVLRQIATFAQRGWYVQCDIARDSEGVEYITATVSDTYRLPCKPAIPPEEND